MPLHQAELEAAPPPGRVVAAHISPPRSVIRLSDDDAIIDVHAGDDLFPLAGRWEFDPTLSAIEFVARYAVFTRVRGRFTSFSGTVVIDPPHFEATQAGVDIDASSVDTAMAACDAHLLDEDFFDVDRHPVISFRSRGAALLAPGRYTAPGELTIRGTSQPVRARRRCVRTCARRAGKPPNRIEGDGKVQRAVWGITWNAPGPAAA